MSILLTPSNSRDSACFKRETRGKLKLRSCLCLDKTRVMAVRMNCIVMIFNLDFYISYIVTSFHRVYGLSYSDTTIQLMTLSTPYNHPKSSRAPTSDAF